MCARDNQDNDIVVVVWKMIRMGSNVQMIIVTQFRMVYKDDPKWQQQYAVCIHCYLLKTVDIPQGTIQ